MSNFVYQASSKLKQFVLNPKKIVFRDNKRFREESFLEDLQYVGPSRNSDSSNENYNYLTCRFLPIVNNHGRLKSKIFGGNKAPFIDKKFEKNIIEKVHLKISI